MLIKDIVAVWRVHNKNTTYQDAKKQLDELKFIDKIYDFAKDYVPAKKLRDWRKQFYRIMCLII